jgi:hypothetical protein
VLGARPLLAPPWFRLRAHGVAGPQRGRQRVQHARRRRHLDPRRDGDVEVVRGAVGRGGVRERSVQAGRSSGATLAVRVLPPHLCSAAVAVPVLAGRRHLVPLPPYLRTHLCSPAACCSRTGNRGQFLLASFVAAVGTALIVAPCLAGK